MISRRQAEFAAWFCVFTMIFVSLVLIQRAINVYEDTIELVSD